MAKDCPELTPEAINLCYQFLIDCIGVHLVNGGKIHLKDFGSFTMIQGSKGPYIKTTLSKQTRKDRNDRLLENMPAHLRPRGPIPFGGLEPPKEYDDDGEESEYYSDGSDSPDDSDVWMDYPSNEEPG